MKRQLREKRKKKHNLREKKKRIPSFIRIPHSHKWSEFFFKTYFLEEKNQYCHHTDFMDVADEGKKTEKIFLLAYRVV